MITFERTRKCFDSDGNELDAGYCEQDERELAMCNLGKCDDSIWEGKNSHWTEFGDLTDCDSNEVKSRHRLCNFSSGASEIRYYEEVFRNYALKYRNFEFKILNIF